MRRLRDRLLIVWTLAAGACTPAFNWREVPLAEAQLQAMFPCKPQRSTRGASEGGRFGPSELHSCKAGDWTFAVGQSQVGDSVDAGPLLEAMRRALAANSGGREVAARVGSVAGSASPADRVTISGRTSDGQPVEVQAQFFARRGRLVQASVVGSRPLPADLAADFFDGLRWVAPP